MEHNHHNHAAITGSNYLNRAFILGIAINSIYVIVEVFAGIFYNSLSLISDAGHNLSDVAALGLAMLAYKLSKRKANERFTYGYRKSTILVSLINSVILFMAIGGIIWESINRISHPVVIQGTAISVVAGIGILINGLSALLFFKNKDHDINIKGAYLHLLADAAVSLGVVFSGVIIALFNLYWIDLLTSLGIIIVIFYSSWNLFKESLTLTMDGVPNSISIQNVIKAINEVDGVANVHHLHVWALSTTQNALTAHIVIQSNYSMEEQLEIKEKIKNILIKMNVEHVTLEIETQHANCHSQNMDSNC